MTSIAREVGRHRRLRASYPRLSRVSLRNTDLDLSGVVSSIAIARLFEEGRYQTRAAIDDPQARDPHVGFVLVRVSVELLSPVHYPGAVDIAIGVGRVGRTSFDYVSALFQGTCCVALSDATVAVRDRQRGAGAVLQPSFQATLTPLRYRGELEQVAR
jgi:acyl-CoA thioester hydrolase